MKAIECPHCDGHLLSETWGTNVSKTYYKCFKCQIKYYMLAGSELLEKKQVLYDNEGNQFIAKLIECEWERIPYA